MRRLSTVFLITAIMYLVAVAVLLFAIHSGLTSPYSIGALGAGLAALAALAGLLAGGGLGGGAADGAPAATEAERPRVHLPAAPPPRPAPQSAEAPAGPVPPPEPRRDTPRFEDAVESIPIGYIGLDADFIVRAVNGEALAILENRDDSLLLDRHFGATQLGAAIYDGPRTSLAGRLLHEFALDMLRQDGAVDLQRLLVPAANGGWAARIRLRGRAWPAGSPAPERYLIWIEREEAPKPSSAAAAPTPAATVASALSGAARYQAPARPAPPHGAAPEAPATAPRAALPPARPAPAPAPAPPTAPAAVPRAPSAFPPAAPYEPLEIEVTARPQSAGRAQFPPAEPSSLFGPAITPEPAPAARRALQETLAERLPEVRSRLDMIASIARFLGTMLAKNDIRARSEAKMIEIQEERIRAALNDLEPPEPQEPDASKRP